MPLIASKNPITLPPFSVLEASNSTFHKLIVLIHLKLATLADAIVIIALSGVMIKLREGFSTAATAAYFC